VRQRLEPQPRIYLAGRETESETLYGIAGARILTFSTAVPAVGAELQATYVGLATGGDIAVTELWLVADEDSAPRTRRLAQDQRGFVPERSRCIYDHVQRVRELLGACVGDVAIDIDDAAIAAVQRIPR
jgi:hypothetical protein